MARDLLNLVFDVELCARNLLRAPSNAGARAQLRDALVRLKVVTDAEKARRHLEEVEGLPECREGSEIPEPPPYVTDVPAPTTEELGRPADAGQELPPARLPYKDD